MATTGARRRGLPLHDGLDDRVLQIRHRLEIIVVDRGALEVASQTFDQIQVRRLHGVPDHRHTVTMDGRLAFVTSANLTSVAMERNMELGVLLRGGAVPCGTHRVKAGASA